MKFNFRKYRIGYFLLTLSFAMSSCNKYLDEKDRSNL